jgi:predicted nucleotidyltransferase
MTAQEISRTDDVIRLFLEKAAPLIRAEFTAASILLFGSRIRGDARPDSDLDAIVISPAFLGIPFVDRAGRLLRRIRFPHALDLLCYTPEEFERMKPLSFVVRCRARRHRSTLSPDRREGSL